MSDLDQVMYWQGIGDNYTNYRGELVHVPIENRKHLLSVMGIDIATEESISKAAYELDVRPWRQWLPPLVTSKVIESQTFVELNLAPSQIDRIFTWTLSVQGAMVDEGSFTPSSFPEVGNYTFDGIRYTRRSISLPAQMPGYYDLKLSIDSSTDSTSFEQKTLFGVIPDTAFNPDYLNDPSDKLWGVIVQLYTLVSDQNWGIGDFADLTELILLSQKNGADFIGLNPLHALLADVSHNRSPYSPSDRRYINPLYIAVDNIEHSSIVDLSDEHQKATQLRNESSVNYKEVKHVKYLAFQKIYDVFYAQEILNKTKLSSNFFTFCREAGESLDVFCFYECVKNSPNATDRDLDVMDAYRSFIQGGTSDAQKYYKEHMMFHAYLQWLAHEQLQECQSTASNAGMRLGLIRDLAVGADGSGAEVQSQKNIFSLQASVGAPPDPLALQGQNWGLPPMIPSEMRETGFAHYIELLRKNMQDCGALRIDHVMAIMRLWWCPPGKSAQAGAYVYYPFETMLNLLILESHLNDCVIIGEDLGIVPEDIREFLSKAEILSNKVMYFEKYDDGSFKLPHDIEGKAFTTINNHDVPTLVSWWNGTDLEIRRELDLLEKGVAYADIFAHRNDEKRHLLERLNEQSLLPQAWLPSEWLEETPPPIKPSLLYRPLQHKNLDGLLSLPADESLIFSVLQLGSRTSSRLFAIQLEDLMMMNDPVNIPGTFAEYANWKRKLGQSTSAIFNLDRVKAILENMVLERKSMGK